MRVLLGWMRVGLIDLRGDLRRFGILIACLALGTGVIAAVGSVGAGFIFAVERDATTMMGGDLEAARPDRTASEQEFAFLKTFGEVARVIDTTARGVTQNNTAFLDLLAVGDNYPLRGNVVADQLPQGEKPASLLAFENGAYGTIVDAVLLDRLQVEIGDRFKISNSEFEIRGTLTSVPDSAVRGFQLGLTTMISAEAFDSLQDLRPPLPGLLTHYRYKIILTETSFEEASAAIKTRFDDEEWSVKSPRDAAGDLVHFYDLFSRFLMIVGLASLLVGGVGVYNGVSAYIGERQRSIATLRSLGATSGRIMVHFLTQIAVLSAIGIGIGVLFGALTSQLILPYVGNAINVSLQALIDPASLYTAAGFGVLAAFAFSYLPLISAQKISPAMLFRSAGTVLPGLQISNFRQSLILLPVIIAGAGIF
ncbi:MAG: FtsX-like permease family protein, partial [Devosiaceae bacterium]|nr:FtsX-like permease family protein [Devosiaceae bacterium]